MNGHNQMILEYIRGDFKFFSVVVTFLAMHCVIATYICIKSACAFDISFKEPPLVSVENIKTEIQVHEVGPIYHTAGFMSRTQITWKECKPGLDVSFSYLSSIQSQYATPDIWSLIITQLKENNQRDMWRFAFSKDWDFIGCEYSQWLGKDMKLSVIASGKNREGLRVPVEYYMNDLKNRCHEIDKKQREEINDSIGEWS